MSDDYVRTQPPIEAQLKSLSVRYEHTKADHFDILMAAVKENEVVKGAWDKFTMALRLVGYDGQS